MRLILWGMFKKVVVADSCAPYVDMCFDNPEAFSGSTLILGAILFSFQIYGDFSGYSDIAIGTAKLFGFELMTNFKFPYFSRDIAEFWRRWHISLSTWFRDYLYIPLGGSRVSKPKAIRNVFVIFLVSGFWHGANWTFIVWGGIHALLFIPLFQFKAIANIWKTCAEKGIQLLLVNPPQLCEEIFEKPRLWRVCRGSRAMIGRWRRLIRCTTTTTTCVGWGPSCIRSGWQGRFWP